MVERDRQAEVWQGLGELDPDWAVLTDAERRWGGWGGAETAFYETGIRDVREVLELVPRPAPDARALDFGSGTGRLSFALAEHFAQVTAVDTSRSMLEELHRRAGARGLTHVVPTHVSELPPRADHDLAVSLLVLQHLESLTKVRAAIHSIAQTVKPGGHVLLELPERAKTTRARIQPKYRLFQAGRALGMPAKSLQQRGLSGISMVTWRRTEVIAFLASAGVTVASCVDREAADYLYVRYVGVRD